MTPEDFLAPLKWCSKCEPPGFKPIDEFYNFTGYPDGKSRYCKTCWNAKGRRYRATPMGSLTQLAANLRSETWSRAPLYKKTMEVNYEAARETLALVGLGMDGKPL